MGTPNLLGLSKKKMKNYYKRSSNYHIFLKKIGKVNTNIYFLNWPKTIHLYGILKFKHLSRAIEERIYKIIFRPTTVIV